MTTTNVPVGEITDILNSQGGFLRVHITVRTGREDIAIVGLQDFDDWLIVSWNPARVAWVSMGRSYRTLGAARRMLATRSAR